MSQSIFDEADKKFLQSKNMFDETEQLSKDSMVKPLTPSCELFKPFVEYIIPYELAIEYLKPQNDLNMRLNEYTKAYIYYFRSIAQFKLYNDHEGANDLSKADTLAKSIPNNTLDFISLAKIEIGRDLPPLHYVLLDEINT